MKIDLSDIKENDCDNTATFTDLISRSERNKRKNNKKNDDTIKESLNEKIEKLSDTSFNKNNSEEEKLEKTLIKQKAINENNKLELTTKLELNLEDNIKYEKRKKGPSPITDIGIFILIALSYFIYSLLFTNFLDNELFLLIDCAVILVMFILFGITILTTRKNNKILEIINLIILISYLTFNIINTLGIIK